MHLSIWRAATSSRLPPRPFKERFVRGLLARRAALSGALPPGVEAGAARPPVAQAAAPLPAQRDRRHDRAGACRAAAVAEVRRSRHRGDGGRPARACHHAGRLRAAGAAPRHQRFHHPPAGAARRRRRGGRRRRLLRRARPITWATRRGAIAFAKRNVDAWSKELAKGPVDAIIVNASGCGTTVKDYGHLLKREPEYAERAARISDLAHDISEFVGKYELGAPKRWSSLRVAYHPACSLQHGQGIKDVPRDSADQGRLHASPTFRNRTSAAARPAPTTSCSRRSPASCASARSKNIKRVKPDVVATGNIGCITQLGRQSRRAGRAHGRAARLGLRRPGAAGPGAARALRVQRARAQAPHRRLHSTLSAPA